jgi:16S rRNA (adenine1518-N6/adenine1519-N6)-dimethyltransferase
MTYQRPVRQGIELKKKHGQNFLKDTIYIEHMIDAVTIKNNTGVIEIGCGEGILTQAILKTPCKVLKVFEIDPEWAAYVQNLYGSDLRMEMILKNVLDENWTGLEQQMPWVMLANLPYHITFPILYKVYRHRAMFQEGVIMVQEEVAQKIVKKTGRDYGYSSLFFQYHFTWTLLDKVPPQAFFPAPKVFSRLMHFVPIKNPVFIPDQEEFWKFIKLCFLQPRRTLRNNLAATTFDGNRLAEEILQKRAQQLTMQDLLTIWDIVRVV